MKNQLTFGKLFLKPADIMIIIAACYLIFSLYSLLWFNTVTQGKAEILLVQFADHAAQEYPLAEDRTIIIDGRKGPSIIEIKQAKARFIHSSCRNQFCVFHGWLSIAGDSSACLPNQISISLKGIHNHYDAIAGSQ